MNIVEAAFLKEFNVTLGGVCYIGKLKEIVAWPRHSPELRMIKADISSLDGVDGYSILSFYVPEFDEEELSSIEYMYSRTSGVSELEIFYPLENLTLSPIIKQIYCEDSLRDIFTILMDTTVTIGSRVMKPHDIGLCVNGSSTKVSNITPRDLNTIIRKLNLHEMRNTEICLIYVMTEGAFDYKELAERFPYSDFFRLVTMYSTICRWRGGVINTTYNERISRCGVYDSCKPIPETLGSTDGIILLHVATHNIYSALEVMGG